MHNLAPKYLVCRNNFSFFDFNNIIPNTIHGIQTLILWYKIPKHALATFIYVVQFFFKEILENWVGSFKLQSQILMNPIIKFFLLSSIEIYTFCSNVIFSNQVSKSKSMLPIIFETNWFVPISLYKIPFAILKIWQVCNQHLIWYTKKWW